MYEEQVKFLADNEGLFKGVYKLIKQSTTFC